MLIRFQTIYLSVVLFFFFSSCGEKESNTTSEPSIESKTPLLSLEEANRLASLPFECLQNEYPNKLGQVLGNSDDIGTPYELHPAFYGCFDWHSSVHGHWSAVKLLKMFPDLNRADTLKEILRTNLSKSNILVELEYFNGKHNSSFERTYGWAWLLKLSEELHTWEDSLGIELYQNLSPLTDLIVQRYLDFLPKLVYPIRVGEHTNTAFGLAFAWDYSNALGHQELKSCIEKRAKEFYLNDTGCPVKWEPSGYDFLSPCLEEIDLMRRVLPPSEFLMWIDKFMPHLSDPNFKLEAGIVSDRSDGKLVHLDGLNFSRAWVLYGLSKQHKQFKHLRITANNHLNNSLPNLIGDSYEGGHWLGSFAIYALSQI